MERGNSSRVSRFSTEAPVISEVSEAVLKVTEIVKVVWAFMLVAEIAVL